MTSSYDLAVVGSGTAAMVAATRVRAAGWKVAVIDHRPFGGTCALRGCDPKKMLRTGAQVIDDIRRMEHRGVTVADARIGWQDLIAFKRTFTDPIPGKREQQFAAKGIHALHGRARFTGPHSLEVDGEVLDARHVLIASGARPATLGIPGEELLITNEEFLELQELPQRIVMVGGGYVAAEFSHIAARAGAIVTVLQRGARLLPHFDAQLVEWLMERFRDLRIDTRTQTSVIGIEKHAQGFRVQTRSPAGTQHVEADLVVHAAGRVPDIDSLNLQAGGVERDERGHIRLNEFLQSSSNPAVYAAGDAAAVGPPLTPVSSHDAKVVVANLLEGNHVRPNYSGVPSVAFTIPPIASVGLSEDAARDRHLPFKVRSERTSDWFTARQVAEPVYGFKVLIEADTERVLGAHLVGPNVDEVINVFGLAIRHDLTATDLKTTMFAYPTGASDVGYMLP